MKHSAASRHMTWMLENTPQPGKARPSCPSLLTRRSSPRLLASIARGALLGYVFGFASPVPATAQALDDYAEGISIEAPNDRPLIEVELPDIVYRTITRPGLADLNVFNAEGQSVPHALCVAPAETAGVVAQHALPVFTLQAAAGANGRGSRIDLSTPAGTALRIQENQTGTPEMPAAQTRAHVIDAREVPDALRSIQFEWRSPDEASEAHVRIEASEDLDRWFVIVEASTLLQVAQGDQQLRRERIPLPERRYRFLRIARADGGPPLTISSVIAESVSQPAPLKPVWFTVGARTSHEAGEWLFDAARLAPVSFARLRLPQDNMSLQIRIQSRGDMEARWVERWSGESYVILASGERRVSAPAQFQPTSDRYWRVLHSSSLDKPPALELGYHPARLQFLAQGSSPYTLAFGSRRASSKQMQACGSLIADVRGDDLERFVAAGRLGEVRTLAGAAALQPPPQPTPVKRIVLWAVLVGGVGLLIAMALSLLRRVRPVG